MELSGVHCSEQHSPTGNLRFAYQLDDGLVGKDVRHFVARETSRASNKTVLCVDWVQLDSTPISHFREHNGALSSDFAQCFHLYLAAVHIFVTPDNLHQLH